jgi:hypothetical protein
MCESRAAGASKMGLVINLLMRLNNKWIDRHDIIMVRLVCGDILKDDGDAMSQSGQSVCRQKVSFILPPLPSTGPKLTNDHREHHFPIQ